MKRKHWEEILIALSVSNLLFISSWRNLLYPTSLSYHIKLEPTPTDHIALMLNVSITALIIYGSLVLSRYFSSGKTNIVVKVVFVGVFGLVVNGLRLQFFEIEFNIFVKIGLLILAMVVSILTILTLRNSIFKYLRAFFLILSPFVLINFSQSIVASIYSKPTTESPIVDQLSEIREHPQKATKERVIWIIFDDLDYYIPFEKTPSIVKLPEFERLKNESLSATKAVSPGYRTLDSIPSLITGRVVKRSEPLGKNELILNYDDGTKAKFSMTPNIFSKINEMKGNTAVVGWYHAYCRVLGKDLSACSWESFDTLNDFEPRPLPTLIVKNFIDCIISLPFGFRLVKYLDLNPQNESRNRGYVKRHHTMVDDAKQIVANPNIELALIHMPFPHNPYLYDATSKEFGSGSTYFDNLIFTDNFLGEIRQTMEKSNLWNESTVIVSSDHQWRINEYRDSLTQLEREITKETEHPQIPFFIKLSGSQQPIVYEKPFNTVITANLILALMRGEISTTEETKNWLDTNTDSP